MVYKRKKKSVLYYFFIWIVIKNGECNVKNKNIESWILFDEPNGVDIVDVALKSTPLKTKRFYLFL